RRQVEPAGRAWRVECGGEYAEDRVDRDQREDPEDRVVEEALAARDHVCPRSAIRVIASVMTKMTQASVKPMAAAEPIWPSRKARLYTWKAGTDVLFPGPPCVVM